MQPSPAQRGPRPTRSKKATSIALSGTAVALLIAGVVLWGLMYLLAAATGIGMSATATDNPVAWILGMLLGIVGLFAPPIAALVAIGLLIGALVTANRAAAKDARIFAVVALGLSALVLVLYLVGSSQGMLLPPR